MSIECPKFSQRVSPAVPELASVEPPPKAREKLLDQRLPTVEAALGAMAVKCPGEVVGELLAPLPQVVSENLPSELLCKGGRGVLFKGVTSFLTNEPLV